MAAGRVVFDGPPQALTMAAVREVYGAEADEISEEITSTSIAEPKRKKFQSAGPLEPAYAGL